MSGRILEIIVYENDEKDEGKKYKFVIYGDNLIYLYEVFPMNLIWTGHLIRRLWEEEGIKM